MNRTDRQHIFLKLRKEFPIFIYQSYSFVFSDSQLDIRFNFSLANKYFFEPTLSIPINDNLRPERVDKTMLENLVFHIGMVELISYWKAACPPVVQILPHSLHPEQMQWWKNLYYHGLGEFFYLNGISANEEDFMQIESKGESPLVTGNQQLEEKYLVPVGGGKDSVVSLEILRKAGISMIPFIINPRPATEGSAKLAGFDARQIITVHRSIDPALLKLNDSGFLNGHTPFSALLAFTTALAAMLSGCRHIALSNESSANEATVPGTTINHQYSKSISFENDFRDYARRYIHPELNYFSLLRPLNELQIVKLFSRFPQYFGTFKSCNVGSKTDSWCGHCPKCLFTALMLSPFVSQQQAEDIFGRNLLADPALKPLLLELSGQSTAKPFECVGTVHEVQAAISHLRKNDPDKTYALLQGIESGNGPDIETLLQQFDNEHNVENKLLDIISAMLHD